MDMIFHATDAQWRTAQGFRYAAQVLVQPSAERFVLQEWEAVFGREDQVQVHGGERLWHGNILQDCL